MESDLDNNNKCYITKQSKEGKVFIGNKITYTEILNEVFTS